MSLEHPSKGQMEKIKNIHRKQMGFRTINGVKIPSTPVITFCTECKQEWPCRTMKAFGVHKDE